MQGGEKAKEDRASAAEKDTSGPPQVYASGVDPLYHQSHWIADRTIDLIRESEPGKPFFRLLFPLWTRIIPLIRRRPYALHVRPGCPWRPPDYEEGELLDKPALIL